jgi:hypothetical protein
MVKNITVRTASCTAILPSRACWQWLPQGQHWHGSCNVERMICNNNCLAQLLRWACLGRNEPVYWALTNAGLPSSTTFGMQLACFGACWVPSCWQVGKPSARAILCLHYLPSQIGMFLMLLKPLCVSTHLYFSFCVRVYTCRILDAVIPESCLLLCTA